VATWLTGDVGAASIAPCTGDDEARLVLPLANSCSAVRAGAVMNRLFGLFRIRCASARFDDPEPPPEATA